MYVTVLHRGVPIGAGELALDDPMGLGDLDPLPAYDSIRAIVRAADRTRRNRGFLPSGDAEVAERTRVEVEAGQRALVRLAALQLHLELRDARGALLATEWIHIWDGDGVRFAAIVAFRAAPAAVPALRHTLPQGGDAREPPA